MSTREELRSELAVPISLDPAAVRKVRPHEVAERFAFGAGIALLAGLVGMRFGHRIGGAFLAFPAVLPAALSLVEKREGESRADVDAGGALIGATAMVGFALASHLVIGRAPMLGLALGWLAWLALAGFLYAATRSVLRRVLG